MTTTCMRSAVGISLVLTVASFAASAADRVDINYTYSAPSEGDLKGEAEQNEFKATASMPVPLNNDSDVGLTLGGLFQLNQWSFDDNNGPLKDIEVYKIMAPSSVSFKASDALPVTATVMPGLSSDLEEIDGDDFLVDASLVGTYLLRKDLQIVLGVAYGDDFGDPTLFPLGGVVWAVSDNLLANLVFPKPRLTYTVSPTLRAYIAGEPTGGQWNIHEEGEDYDFQQKGFRVGLGGEYKIIDGGWLYAMVGMEGNRTLSVERTDGSSSEEDVDLDNNSFFQIGFRIQ